jgi:hypothetical protein
MHPQRNRRQDPKNKKEKEKEKKIDENTHTPKHSLAKQKSKKVGHVVTRRWKSADTTTKYGE